jgi:hypothetical protein
MTAVFLCVEGGATGPNSQTSQRKCRIAFETLLVNSGFRGKLPRISVGGGRSTAMDDFVAKSRSNPGALILLLVDSEEPVIDVERPLAHLKNRDRWTPPEDLTVSDDQVFLMTTSMETWIVADRAALKRFFDAEFAENRLPPLFDLEARDRHSVLQGLVAATRECRRKYTKGDTSFEVLAETDPSQLTQLKAFQRMLRILRNCL